MTAAETRTLDRCLACGSTRLAPVAFRYLWDGGEFPMAACRDCDMRFLSVQPAGAALARMYSAGYFEQDYRCGRAATHSFDEAGFRAENAGLLDRFERYRGGGRLLEVGCASGWLLQHAAGRGWTVAGVELSEHAVAHARSLGLDVRQGTLEHAAYPPASFDLVYMGDVLEHVPDCRATLAEVARVLVPGGHLYLRGPITMNSLARRAGLALYRAIGRSLVVRKPPYHLWEFTPRSLARVAAAVGLEPVLVEQAKIPPGARARHGLVQDALTVALDAVNVPLTRAFHAFGDRVIMVARRRVG